MDNWEDTKRYIKDLPRDYKTLIEEQMRKDAKSVRVLKDLVKGTLYEWNFFHNGFECFVEFQTFNNSKEDWVRYFAFNDNKNSCFVRLPNKEDL